MSFAAAVDHLHALGLELAPEPASAAAWDASAAGSLNLAAPPPRRKFDLDHMRILAAALGDPQKQFPAVLIAGTNGKGSTAATLASILAAAGYRTGLYTSPHLSRVTERIRVSQGREQGSESRDREQDSGTSRSSPLPSPCLTVPCLAEIPEEVFARLYFRVDNVARQLVEEGQLPHHPSFFECLTALAFLYFAEQRLDIAILEVGLGGRLDATNIVDPILSVITDIALDHQDYLGNTITEIAREKAGILRAGGTLITLPQHPEANQAIGEAAIALNVRLIEASYCLPVRSAFPDQSTELADPAFQCAAAPQPAVSRAERTTASALRPYLIAAIRPFAAKSSILEGSPLPASPLISNHYDLLFDGELLNIRSPLAGQHQQRNLALAIAAALELRNQTRHKSESTPHDLRTADLEPLYNILNSAIEAGIANTSWPGRLEFLSPDLLFDVAHNPAGAWTLRAAIATLPEHLPRTLIFSCLRDKDLTEMAQILFPLFDSSSDRPQDHIVLAPVDNPRAASLDGLLGTARALEIPAHPAHNPIEALALARSLTPAGGLIFITGSIYLVGALREAVLPQ